MTLSPLSFRRVRGALALLTLMTSTAVLATIPAVGAQALRPAPPVATGADQITESQLRAYLTFIAADDREGRATPSRGLDATAQFIAALVERWGLKPLGDQGGYLQKFSLTRRTIVPATTSLTLGSQSFPFGEGILADAVAGRVEGPLVFVGHGLSVPSKNLNPYKGVDVTGKVLIAQAGLPDGLRDSDLGGRPGTKWDSPQTYAAKHGAKGVIFVPSFPRLSQWASQQRRATEFGQLSYPDDADAPATVPSITASAAVLEALFARERLTAADVLRLTLERKSGDAFELDAAKIVRFEVTVSETAAPTQNVVALLEGRDPVLKREVVAIGAHYDHVGVQGTGPDRIYNGADDDGSGTSAVLAIAEAFAHHTPPPKRSLLFVWHAGEETGLLGSRWITDHPPVPLGDIITQLNIDMVGRSKAPQDSNPKNSALTGPHELYVIGSKMMSRDLGELSEQVNESYLNLKFNYKYDDPEDPERFFYRSDHFNYARKGVPIIFYFSGVHEDYHQPTDSIEKIDFSKLTKVARTVFATAATLADRPARPRVDSPLPASVTDR